MSSAELNEPIDPVSNNKESASSERQKKEVGATMDANAASVPPLDINLWKDASGKELIVYVATVKEKRYVIDIFLGVNNTSEREFRNAKELDRRVQAGENPEAACQSIFESLLPEHRSLVAKTRQGQYEYIVDQDTGLVHVYPLPNRDDGSDCDDWDDHSETSRVSAGSGRRPSVSRSSADDSHTVPQPGSGQSIGLSDISDFSMKPDSQSPAVDNSVNGDSDFTGGGQPGDPTVEVVAASTIISKGSTSQT